MSIKPLPPDVVDKIRSSVSVTHLNGVICGLLKNSLDAAASKVNISFDQTRASCTVEDNGRGIKPWEFQPDGGLGKLHHTSRFPPSPVYHGKRGDFLASVAALSLLTITSRQALHNLTPTLCIHNSQTLSRYPVASDDHRFTTFENGTRVTVRDLFGDLPVRVKQRPRLEDRAALDKNWSSVVQYIVGLLLAWPSPVTVFLKDNVTQRELRLRPSDQTFKASRTSQLLAQASLTGSTEPTSWITSSASRAGIRLQCHMYDKPVASRRSQFISFGVHPLTNDYGTDALYETINKAFNDSSFGVVDGDGTTDGPIGDNLTGRDLRSRKGIERWPMFYMKIDVEDWSDAIDVEERASIPGNGLLDVLDLIKAFCYSFLKSRRYRPQKIDRANPMSKAKVARFPSNGRKELKRQPLSAGNISRSKSSSRPGSATSISRTDSPFDDWERVKVGKAMHSTPDSKPTATPSTERPSYSSPLVGEGGKLLRKPFQEPSPEPEINNDGCMESQTPMIISHSGLPPFKRSLDGASTSPEKRQCVDVPTRPKPKEWLQRVHREWENPVFETVESSVPRLQGEASDQQNDMGCSSCGKDGSISFESSSVNLAGRITKDALAQANVISQVDRKFVLVKLPLASLKSTASQQATALILLDQHAADERCRLEDLMAAYFITDPSTGDVHPNIELLDRPLTFEPPGQERQLLMQHREYFDAWGIQYHRKAATVVVTGLPPAILERCRSEPRLLISLLRKQIWHLVDYGTPPIRNSRSTSFHGCPQGILDLLYSRACRSAIMFNDELARDECVALVARLAKCAFPFQCAHGRPSVAPLVDLSDRGSVGGWRESGGENWKVWMSS